MTKPTTQVLDEAAQAVLKNRSGDHISDQELKSGIAALRDIIYFMEQLGPRFFFATVELRRNLYQLKDYESARRT